MPLELVIYNSAATEPVDFGSNVQLPPSPISWIGMARIIATDPGDTLKASRVDSHAGDRKTVTLPVPSAYLLS
jgi:hypothetical protein